MLNVVAVARPTKVHDDRRIPVPVVQNYWRVRSDAEVGNDHSLVIVYFVGVGEPRYPEIVASGNLVSDRVKRGFIMTMRWSSGDNA